MEAIHPVREPAQRILEDDAAKRESGDGECGLRFAVTGTHGVDRQQTDQSRIERAVDECARDGNRRQTTFTFQLTLATVKDGLNVWEGETPIMKQGTVGGAFGL